MKYRLTAALFITIIFILPIGIGYYFRDQNSDHYTTEDVLKLFTSDKNQKAEAKKDERTVNVPQTSQERHWWPKSGKYRVLSANITPKGDVFENLLLVEYLSDGTHHKIQIETGGEMNCKVGTIVNVKLLPGGGTMVESAD